MRILVIEDDEQCLESLALAFGFYWPGSNLLSAHRGAEGMELLKTEGPDIIVLDLGLPDIAGFELLKQIRTISTTPVVILSARNEEATIKKGLQLGANDYVTKPFNPRNLITRLQEIAPDKPGQDTISIVP